MKHFPHPVVILLAFIVLATALSWIIPAGQYQRVIDDATGREKVVQGTYQVIESHPVGVFQMLVAIPAGFVDSADVIVLILILGGCFYVIDKTGAFNEALAWMIGRLKNAKSVVLIFVGLLFAAGGAMNGLQEEVVAMMPILLLLTHKTGYSKETAVAIGLGSAIVGSSFSPVNPFGVLIAQKVAEVPPFSDSIFRLVFLLIALCVWWAYALKKGKITDATTDELQGMAASLSMRSVVILVFLALTFGIMIYGLVALEWDFLQMCAPFFALTFVAGFIGGLGLSGTAKAYTEGFAELIFAGMVVALARSIYLIMQEGLIIDTIIYALFTPLQGLAKPVTTLGMLASHTLLHVPVPSTSGQAMLTMPLLAPLADLIGLSRQVVVLAYQFGAGLTDLFTPTNGAVMAVLAAGKVQYNEWLRFAGKAILLVFGVAALALISALLLGI